MKQVSSSSSASAINATDDNIPDTPAMPPFSPDAAKPFVGARRVLSRLWSIMTANRKALAGSIIIAAFIAVALVGPIIIRQNPLAYGKVLVQPPSSAHLLGTNQVGQDVFVQLVVRTRSSVVWAFITGLMVMVISIAVG